jgi:hypothetical protein
MANKIKIPKLEASSFRGWTFVVVAGVVLTVLALIDKGSFSSDRSTGSTGCVVKVVVAADPVTGRQGTLVLRESPSSSSPQKGSLPNGTKVDAEPGTQNNFRHLTDGTWASADYLVPQVGSRC